MLENQNTALKSLEVGRSILVSAEVNPLSWSELAMALKMVSMPIKP